MPGVPTSTPAARPSRRAALRGAAALLLNTALPARVTRAASTPEPATPLAGSATVTGTVEFPANLPHGEPATIYVRVEDVSRADAPSVLVASATLPDIPTPPAAGEPVSFSIPVTSYNPRLSYTVRVHVDRDGDGQVSVGDLVSTSHHPVLTRGAGNVVVVPVSVV